MSDLKDRQSLEKQGGEKWSENPPTFACVCKHTCNVHIHTFRDTCAYGNHTNNSAKDYWKLNNGMLRVMFPLVIIEIFFFFFLYLYLVLKSRIRVLACLLSEDQMGSSRRIPQRPGNSGFLLSPSAQGV